MKKALITGITGEPLAPSSVGCFTSLTQLIFTVTFSTGVKASGVTV